VGEGHGDRGLELSSAGKFENTRDLAGDLLGAKNVGVTVNLQSTSSDIFYFFIISSIFSR
jgi:hypothetical protein